MTPVTLQKQEAEEWLAGVVGEGSRTGFVAAKSSVMRDEKVPQPAIQQSPHS